MEIFDANVRAFSRNFLMIENEFLVVENIVEARFVYRKYFESKKN